MEFGALAIVSSLPPPNHQYPIHALARVFRLLSVGGKDENLRDTTALLPAASGRHGPNNSGDTQQAKK
jgi:hypothetical protein